MRNLALGFAALALIGSAEAQVLNENACRLQYLSGVQSGIGIALINDACGFLGSWSSTMELNRRERLYHECLLRSLSGVQNDQAATLIAQSCRNQAQAQ